MEMAFTAGSRHTRQRRPEILADGWFSWIGTSEGANGWEALTTAVPRLLGARLAERILAVNALRGVALAVLSTRYRAVAVIRYDRGWRTLLLLRALIGRDRKLVVLQCFDHPPARTLAGRLWQPIDRWALRRSLAVAQVMSPRELATYPESFGIAAERFTLIRFPTRTAARGTPAPYPRENGPIVAAGRAHCDWPTLFAAAGGRGWDLQVVCSAEDRERVEALNRNHRAGAQISVELSQADAHALLAHAAISVICVTDGLVGRGHIRLAEAADTGTAIVASDVSGLEGYVRHGETAVLVPPGDPAALRAAVEGLIRDPARRSALALNAFAAGEQWTGPDYVAALQALAAGASGGPGPVARP